MQPNLYPVGTVFKPIGKHSKECTVIDIYITKNLKGEIVQTRYVATHEFLGQKVTDYDVVAVTIARGFIK